MKIKSLLPFGFRFIGLGLLIIFGTLFYLWSQYDLSIPLFVFEEFPKESISAIFEDGDYTNEFIFAGLILSLVCLAFSRGRVEDERSASVRLQSLHISHYINYFIILLWIFLAKGFGFLVVAVALPYIFLLSFLIIYYSRMYILPLLQDTSNHEEYH